MKRVILACIATAALVPLTAQGTALANDSAMPDVGQSAGGSQTAGSSAKSTQLGASNENISVRIMSPGDDGAVPQINSAAAASAAGNRTTTSQGAAQSGAARQAVGQAAHNAQAALSAAESTQVAPRNENIAVRIMSPGDAGDVEQVNASSAESAAGNENATSQSAEQSGSGGDAPVAPKASRPEEQSGGKVPPPKPEPCAPACGGGKPTVQAIGQDVVGKQVAESAAISLQDHPVNANHGGGGSVDQVNDSAARSAAGNANWTDQKAVQSVDRGAPDMVAACRPCSHDGTVVQAIGQRVKSEQLALSKAVSVQRRPVNLDAPSVHKDTWPDKRMPKGGEAAAKPSEPPTGEEAAPKPAGDVRQVNASEALSAAGNENPTSQTASQFGGRWPVTM